MGSFWKAGIGNYVAVIAMSGEVYVENPEIEVKKHALHILEQVEKAYAQIPFSTLDKNAKEFKPIFEVKSLIPNVREGLQALYENPNDYTARKIFLTGKHIVNLGRLYDKYLHNSISQLRRIEGYEDYTIEVEHIEKTREEVIKKRGHLRRLGAEGFSEVNTSFFEKEVVKSRKELQDYISGEKTEESGKTKNQA